MKPDSAKGIDGISYRMINNMHDTEKEALFQLLKNTWVVGRIPKEWRHIKVIPILKPNKDPTSIESHRPISLLSTLCKAMEFFIKCHLDQHVDQYDLLLPRLYAFSKKRSTAQCINDVINSVLYYKSMGKHVVGAGVDLHKAYDYVNVNTLTYILRESNITEAVVDWIRDFLNK